MLKRLEVRQAVALFVASVVAEVLGLAVHPFASDPDYGFAGLGTLGVFFVFLFFAGSVLALGSALSRLLKLDRPDLLASMALGTGAAALLATALAAVGLCGPSNQSLCYVLLFGAHL